jgi:O-antigen/teichoic acid export membrane protein
VFVDRFAIGSVLGATSVAIYSVPFQLTRLVAVLPASLVSALFPKMSASQGGERDEMTAVATRAMALLITPMVLGGIFAFDLFLHFWVGREIAVQATPIGRILLIGFWANAFALLPVTKLQTSGRPDLVTKVLLLQIPFYLVALYVGLTQFGLVGCAIVFTARCVVDYLILSRVATRPLGETLMLAVNITILTLAALASTIWRMNQLEWWLAAVTALAIVLLINWRVLPKDAKTQFLAIAKLRGLRRG